MCDLSDSPWFSNLHENTLINHTVLQYLIEIRKFTNSNKIIKLNSQIQIRKLKLNSQIQIRKLKLNSQFQIRKFQMKLNALKCTVHYIMIVKHLPWSIVEGLMPYELLIEIKKIN